MFPTNAPSPSPRRHHRIVARPFGFTLVELLIVFAIIGVLVSLILPAVQSARESARRMTCGNRMRQIGLAVHNYHDAFRTMPRSWWLELQPQRPFNGKPWGYILLPQLEQQALFERFNSNTLPVDQLSPQSVAAGGTTVAQYVCPSTPSDPASRRYLFDARSTGLPFTAGMLSPTDYSPTSGVRSEYAKIAFRNVRGNAPPDRIGALPAVAAMFSEGHDATFAAIFDGLSNTFLFGERTGGSVIYTKGNIDQQATNSLLGLNGGGWADLLSGDHWLSGSSPDGIGFPPQAGRCGINCTSARGYGFHSFHLSGAQFVYADGSVSMISENVDPTVLASSITRRGHEVIESP